MYYPIAKLLPLPADALNHVVDAPNCTGLDLAVVSPNPSCPVELAPQDHNVLSVLSARL